MANVTKEDLIKAENLIHKIAARAKEVKFSKENSTIMIGSIMPVVAALHEKGFDFNQEELTDISSAMGAVFQMGYFHKEIEMETN